MTTIRRDPEHPIPAGNVAGRYLNDGAYASHDGTAVWVSCDRDDGLHAVALDLDALAALVRYARGLGWKGIDL